jgi:F0F1-type ATP synthase alpha subunit
LLSFSYSIFILLSHCSIYNIFNSEFRIALRGKVNDTVNIGLTSIESMLPIGRGQRQLILGDRNTGKTSIFVAAVVTANLKEVSLNSFGSKRLFCFYVGICLNLSKLYKLIDTIVLNKCFTFYCLSTHSSSSAMLTFTAPMNGIVIAEIMRDRGFDCLIAFDDLSKHSKCYRQISLTLGNMVGRDAFPANIFNIHSSLLERCGKLNNI